MKAAWMVVLACSVAAGSDWIEQEKRRGATLESEHRWGEAIDVYRTALDRLGSTGSPRHRFWLLAGIAEAAFESQNYTEAREWLRKAEEVGRTLGPNTPEQARVLNARGTLHLVEGNLRAAERNLSDAATISGTIGLPADRAAALNNLAAVEMQTRRIEEAMVHQTEALNLWRAAFGDRHLYVTKAWISLSSLQGLRGDWRAAEHSLQEALAISESPEALANYAVVLEKLKRGDEAKKIRRRLGKPVPLRPVVIDVKALAQESAKVRVRAR